jgi:hypothetical protein
MLAVVEQASFGAKNLAIASLESNAPHWSPADAKSSASTAVDRAPLRPKNANI